MKNTVIRYRYLFLAIIVLIQIGFLTARYAHKNSRYIDEFYAYGIANNYYAPFIGGTDTSGTNNTWLTGDDFKYYTRTSKDTNFRYDSVFYNASNDTAAPLYSVLLHTVSSFFPDQFSWWWGFWINIAAFAAGQIFLYKLIRRFTGSDIASLIGCLFYGFTIGCIYSVSFVRNYELENAFLLMYLYFSAAVFTEKEVKFAKTILPVFISALAAFFSHYLFILFAFFYTALQCLILLFNKKYKHMFLYGGAVLAAILLLFVIFPASFKSTFGLELWQKETKFIPQLHIMTRLFVIDTTGYKMSETFNTTVTVIVLAAIFLPVTAVICAVLFRNEQWWKDLKKGAANAFKRVFTGKGSAVVCILFAVTAYIVYVAKRVYYPDMGDVADRYIFMCMPPFVAAVSAVLYKVTSAAKNKNKIRGVLAVAMILSLVFQQFGATGVYTMNYPGNEEIPNLLAGENCLLVKDHPQYSAMYCDMLQNCADIYLTSYADGSYTEADIDYEKLYNGKDYFYMLLNISEISSFFNEADRETVIRELLTYYGTGSQSSDCVFCADGVTSTNTIYLYRFQK